MLLLIVRRILVAIPTLFLVSMLAFGLQKAMPGDVVLASLGEERDPAIVAAKRAELGLDKPIPFQYVAWLGRVAQGDLGVSHKTGEPVADLILQKLPVTVELAILSMFLALLMGIPAGIISAVWKGRAPDHIANVTSLTLLSVPNFWLGIMLILIVAQHWRLLPASGYVPLWEDPVQNLRCMIMPAFVLATALAATLMRHTRSAMLGVLRSDYIRTARAKGLSSRIVVLKHALRNALGPIITLSAVLFGQLLAGAVLTEQVFSIPGFGRLVIEAVFGRETDQIQAIVLCTAVGFIALNTLADILYILVNPRLRNA